MRQAMIIAARGWLAELQRPYIANYEVAEMMADFVLHMTGADAPELRYVEPRGDGRNVGFQQRRLPCGHWTAYANDECDICALVKGRL
jgi:hypothetical protein